MKTKTQFTQEQINEVMQNRGTTRKSAIRWLNRNQEDRPKGKAAAAPAVDVKQRAANDRSEQADAVTVPGIGTVKLVPAPKTDTAAKTLTSEERGKARAE